MMQTFNNQFSTHMLTTLRALTKTFVFSGCFVIINTGCSHTLTQPTHHIIKSKTNKKITASTDTPLTDYQLDPHHTNIRFAIKHMNTSTVTGGFYELQGVVRFSMVNKSGEANITIPMDSLHSVSNTFTEHLKAKDFFDTKTYPTATFESSEWYFNHDKVSQIDGYLTLKGIRKPVSLRAKQFNCYFSPIAKKTVCGGDFTAVINRTQWGIDKYVLLGIPKEVTLDIEIEAIKQ